jgi:hypothetical protein
MTRARTKDGKFAKKVDNPDCDPATKGYVKCLLRKTRDHTHQQMGGGNWIDLCAICGWFTLAMVVVFINASRTSPFPEEWWAAITMFSIACTAMAVDKYETTYTGSPDPKEPACIKAYDPQCGRYNMEEAMREWNEKHKKCE